MRSLEFGLILSLLLAPLVARGAETTTESPKRAPTAGVFHSACGLGESMAKSLRGSREPWSKEQAEKTCGILQPKMDGEDAAEFLRCCIQSLTSGANPSAPPPGTDKT